MRRHTYALFVGLLIAGFSAQADAASPHDRAAADRLFKSGRAAAKRGEYGAACSDFAESHRLDPALGTLLNLSECEEKLGRLVSSARHLQQAIGRLGAKDERRAPARERLETLTARIPHIVVRLSPDAPKGTAVARDGVPVDAAVLGTPDDVDPGDHTIVVHAPEREDASFRVSLAEGEDRTIEVAPGPRLASTPPAPAPAFAPAPAKTTDPETRDDPGATQRTIGLVVGGVGLVGLGVGAVFGIVALGHKSDRDKVCAAYPSCDNIPSNDVVRMNQVKASQNSFQSTGTISTVSVALGGAALIAGAVLYLTAGHRSSSATSTARLVPTVGREGMGFAFASTW